MAFDEAVAVRVRDVLTEATTEALVERKMFGGIAFMVAGHMCCGVIDDILMARVGPQQYRHALSLAHAREMDFTGKPLNGFVYVAPPGFRTRRDLRAWIARALEFVHSLPARE